MFKKSILVGIILIVGYSYLWTVTSNSLDFNFGKPQNDYYNEQIDGWREGHLSMKVEVPAALLELKDPYNPINRPQGLVLHDASFYRGKYYIYFGVAPALVLMLPFRLITGIQLPLAFSILIFAYVTLILASWLFLQVRQKYCSKQSLYIDCVSLFILGIASLEPVILRRPQLWELPITGALCFNFLSLACLWNCMHKTQKKTWLTLASICLGLAIASRPTYLLAVPALLLFVYYYIKKGLPKLGLILSCMIPLACIGILVAVHNTLRFNNPFEFGQTYQLSSDYEAKQKHFSLAYVGFNSWRYFFSFPTWFKTFPFISPAKFKALPEGMGGYEDVYGIFSSLPVSLSIFLLFFVFKSPRYKIVFKVWLAGSLMSCMALIAIELAFFGSCTRYLLDFTPLIILLSCLSAVLYLDRAKEGSQKRYICTLIVWSGLGIYSLLVAILFSFQANGFFKERNQNLYDKTARLSNIIPGNIELLFGLKPHSEILDFQLGPLENKSTQTLVRIGESPSYERIFIRYSDDKHVQYGYSNPDMPDVLSKPILLNTKAINHLSITLGSLLPTYTHPWYNQATLNEARRASKVLQLELNGSPIISTFRNYLHKSNPSIQLGTSIKEDSPYSTFHGKIISFSEAALNLNELVSVQTAIKTHPVTDTYLFKLRLPSNSWHKSEPLIVTGKPGMGDLFEVRYIDNTHIQFCIDHWGDILIHSDSIAIDYTQLHTLIVYLPWLIKAEGHRVHRGQLSVSLDNATVWQMKTAGYYADSEDIYIGYNPIGGSTATEYFTGELQEFQK